MAHYKPERRLIQRRIASSSVIMRVGRRGSIYRLLSIEIDYSANIIVSEMVLFYLYWLKAVVYHYEYNIIGIWARDPGRDASSCYSLKALPPWHLEISFAMAIRHGWPDNKVIMTEMDISLWYLVDVPRRWKVGSRWQKSTISGILKASGGGGIGFSWEGVARVIQWWCSLGKSRYMLLMGE